MSSDKTRDDVAAVLDRIAEFGSALAPSLPGPGAVIGAVVAAGIGLIATFVRAGTTPVQITRVQSAIEARLRADQDVDQWLGEMGI